MNQSCPDLGIQIARASLSGLDRCRVWQLPLETGLTLDRDQRPAGTPGSLPVNASSGIADDLGSFEIMPPATPTPIT